MSAQKSRAELEKMTKPQLIVYIRDVQQKGGHSGKNVPELIELALNPNPVYKSPGRPKSSTAVQKPAKPSTGSKAGRPKQIPTDKSKSVDYSKAGLMDLTQEVLKKLARDKGVESFSNKNKADLVTALLEKPHHVTITIETKKDGATSIVHVNPTSMSRAVPERSGTTSSTHLSPRGQNFNIAGTVEQVRTSPGTQYTGRLPSPNRVATLTPRTMQMQQGSRQ